MELISVIMPPAALILVAVIEAAAARERKRGKADREKSESNAKLRAEESRLAMQMMDASVALGVATAMAVEKQEINGEMKEAKRKAAEAQDEYRRFVERLAARQVAKL